MRVLHVCNYHRTTWGSDRAWSSTIAVSRAAGMDVHVFSRDSASLPGGTRGRVRAALDAVRPGEAVRSFAATLEALRPDIVHTHELYPLISPWILPLCTRARVPVVHTCYDFRLTCPIATHFVHGAICRRCARGAEHWAVLRNCRGNLAESAAYALRNWVARTRRLFLDHVSQFIVLTPYSAGWLAREVGVEPHRVTVQPCLVELPEDAGPAARDGGDYVGFAGRFTLEKGSHLLVEAVRRTGLPTRLAGNQPTHPAVRSDDPVTCVLTPNPGDLARFYAGARIVVVPSLWDETFGLVAAEAMAHGKPVVAARIGALADTVVDGETGLLFKPGDVDDLARQLRRLWDDPALCRQLGNAGRHRVRTAFDAGSHLACLQEAYDAALRRLHA